MRLVEVTPNEDYTLHVVSEAGQQGLFDVTPFLEGDAFLPLKDRKEFERIYNGKFFIEWDCGADLPVDTIEARWQVVKEIKHSTPA